MKGGETIYLQGPWIWWHRLIAGVIHLFAVLTTIGFLTVQRQMWSEPSSMDVALTMLTLLIATTLLLLSVVTFLRGCERVSWIALHPDDLLEIRTLNGGIRRLPAAKVGKRQFTRVGADPHTGFTWTEPRLLLPVEGGTALHIDLMDGRIVNEEAFARLFRWWKQSPYARPADAPPRRRRRKKAA